MLSAKAQHTNSIKCTDDVVMKCYQRVKHENAGLDIWLLCYQGDGKGEELNRGRCRHDCWIKH